MAEPGKVPDGIGASWAQALAEEFSKDYFKELQHMLVMEKKNASILVLPPEDKIYAWTQHCDIQDVKVVIIAQEPYTAPGQAHGLSYSVAPGIAPPPILRNVFKELQVDIPGFKQPNHGDLTEWAKQGVLLLNSVLTVRASEANSHKDDGWETFTDAVISWIDTNLDGVVFLLWGDKAQKKGAAVNQDKHLVLSAPRPAALTAFQGFYGCKHFSKANQFLTSKGKTPINWIFNE